MQSILLLAALDDGGRELSRVLMGVVAVVGLALLLAVGAPVALVGSTVAPLTAPAARETAGIRAPIAAFTVPGGQPGMIEGPLAGAATGAPRVEQPLGAASVALARRYLGVPYLFGGTDPRTGLDCSGLVQLVYRQLGALLPRTAQQQYAATARLTQAELRPGDLVFFARTYADPHDWVTHVGVYVGDGLMINAPTTGDVVREMAVFSGFWGAHYVGAGRVGVRA